MPRFRRDLGLLGAAVLAASLAASLAALPACSPERSAAPPAPSPTSPPPSPAPTPTPAPRATVIGVFGDWGIRGGRAADVVRLVNGWRPLDAVLTTGDNAYGRGRPAEAEFARRILAPLVAGGARLYASLGNHDEVTAGGDHVMRALGMPARWYTARVGAVELVVLDANRVEDPEQAAFVKRVLSAPKPAPYRVVVFHQPAVSCSFHGPDTRVVKRWVPLFRGHVDLVLSGHNHTYERFTVDGVPYVTTGGGGASLYPSLPGTCRGPGRVRFVRTAYHAVRLTVTPERLRLDAVGLDGKVFDSVTV